MTLLIENIDVFSGFFLVKSETDHTIIEPTIPGVTVCPCMRFPCVIRSGYLVLANQHTSSEGQGSRDLRQTRVEPY